jgi:hypothetical protein
VSAEIVLLTVATTGAGIAALFAILCFLRTQQLPGALTAQGATQILRGETESLEPPSRTRPAACDRSWANR